MTLFLIIAAWLCGWWAFTIGCVFSAVCLGSIRERQLRAKDPRRIPHSALRTPHLTTLNPQLLHRL
jgi:hypothetical protein